ncbi:MAG: hypothetical protein ACRDAM_03430 [Casimicrobium sp.]
MNSTKCERVSWVKTLVAMSLSLVVFGCAQTPTPAPTAQPDNTITPPTPVIVAPKAPEAPSAPPAQAATPAVPATPAAAPARTMNAATIAKAEALTPAGKTRYACEVRGARSDIALPQGTDRICSRFPAMGPCQYERDECRAKGGRVIRFDGVEITKDVESEYDKQVQRFRLNAG